MVEFVVFCSADREVATAHIHIQNWDCITAKRSFMTLASAEKMESKASHLGNTFQIKDTALRRICQSVRSTKDYSVLNSIDYI